MAAFVGKKNIFMNEFDAENESDGLTCPVCDKPLGEPNFCYSVGVSGYNPIISKNYKVAAKESQARRKQLEEEWEGRRHRKPDSEVVIAATCGELFHKACLMKFCASTFKENKRTGPLVLRKEMERSKDKASHNMPQCPRCSRNIMYSYHREIDIDSHKLKGPTEFDRDFMKTEIMGQELKDQYEKEKQNLERLERALVDAEAQLKQAKERQEETDKMIPSGGLPSSVKDGLKSFKKRKKDHKTMESYIEKAQKVIEYMQKETPSIMKMYLNQVKTRSCEDIIKNTPIPAIFASYLDKICEDEYCLFALSQIIKPAPYPGANFDENSLISSILDKVDPAFKHKLTRRASKLGHRDLLAAYENLHPEVTDKQTETNEISKTISNEITDFDGITICEVDENNKTPSQHEVAITSMVDDVLYGNEEVSAMERKLSDLISRSTTSRLEVAEPSESVTTTEFIHVRRPRKSRMGLGYRTSDSAIERSHSNLAMKSRRSPRWRKSCSSMSKVESEELIRACSSTSVMVSDFEKEGDSRPFRIVSFEDDHLTPAEGFVEQTQKADSNYDEYQTTEWSDEEEVDVGRPETPQFPVPTELISTDDEENKGTEDEKSGDEAPRKELPFSLKAPYISEALLHQTDAFIVQCNQFLSKAAMDKANGNEAKNSSDSESKSDSDAEYTPSGNLLCSVFKKEIEDSSEKSPTGFLEFISAKDMREMKVPVKPPNPNVFVTCLAPELSKYDLTNNPHFPKAPEVVAYGPLKNEDGTNLKVPLAYLGHYPPKHEINRTWIAHMESPTNVALGDWYIPPAPPSPPVRALRPSLLAPPVTHQTGTLAAQQFCLRQPFPHTAAYLSLHKQVGDASSFYDSPVAFQMHSLNSCRHQTNVLPSKYSVMLSSLEMGTGHDHISIPMDVPQSAFNVEYEINSAAENQGQKKHKQKNLGIINQIAKLCAAVDPPMSKAEDSRARRRSISISGDQSGRRRKSTGKSKSSRSQKSNEDELNGAKLEVTIPATAAIGLKQAKKDGILKRSAISLSKLLTPRRNKSSDSVEPSETRRRKEAEANSSGRKRSLPAIRKIQSNKSHNSGANSEESAAIGERKKLWKSNFFSGKSKNKDE